MAIIVEDGTGKTDSESYLSVATYKSYLTKFGYDADSGTDEVIEGALRRSLFAIDAYNFLGVRSNTDQALSWPRADVNYDGAYIDSDEIPINLQYAQAEAARLERSGTGTTQPSVTKNIKRKKIDVLETEYFSPAGSTISYSTVLDFLNGLIYSNTVIEFGRA